MSDQARNNLVMVRKFKNKDDADAARDRNLQHFCYWLIDNFKQVNDVPAQVNSCFLEFEAFFNAVMGRGTHPTLERCFAERGQGKPPAGPGELRARRLITLIAVALHRNNTGMSMAEARRIAAREANNACVFPGETITAKSIEHWEERQPELTPHDEQLVSTAIATAEAKHRLALYFVGLAHFAHNPSVAVVQERSS
jgi:hypothetical protein